MVGHSGYYLPQPPSDGLPRRIRSGRSIRHQREESRHATREVGGGDAWLCRGGAGSRRRPGAAAQRRVQDRVLEPLTGNLAAEGKRHLEGFEIMRDLINERGGVMGKKLVFAVGDAVDPTVAASEATRLATREGVKIITGTFSSTLCGAASEAASRQNVIYWETSCVDPRFTQRGLKNVFRTEIDGTGFGWYNIEFIAKHLSHRLGKKPNELRIAYLSEDSSYGQSVTESARQRAKTEFGMQEVGLEIGRASCRERVEI